MSSNAPEVDNLSFFKISSDAIAYVPQGTYKQYWLMLNGFKEIIEFGGITITLNPIELALEPGQIAQITATEECGPLASVAKREWRSGLNTIATVDPYGNVTAVGEGFTSIFYKVTDNFGVTYGRSCSVTVKNPSGVDAVEIDDDNAEYFTLQGIRLQNTPTAPGLYIRRSSYGETKVIVIR